MDRPSFVIRPEEAETAAKQHGVSVVNLLASLVTPAKSFARTPISNFPVGAVGLGSSGRIFIGVNVEFLNLPLHHSIHAEQFLITNLNLNSEQHLRYFSVSSAPCGHCRQFLQEIRNAPEIKIKITDPNAFRDSMEKEDIGDGFTRLQSILPHRFGPDDLLEKHIPLLLEPHNNRLIFSDPDFAFSDPDFEREDEENSDSNLKQIALAAANRSYAPYSKCPSGVSMVDSDGKVYRGWYMESAAYNPSLGPVQAALVDFVAKSDGLGYERIIGAVLVEKKDAVVRQEKTAKLIFETISPNCEVKIFHCHET